MKDKSKMKNLLSAAAPSGELTLGNYLGAIKKWTEMQNQYNCFFPVVNQHVITVKQDPNILKKRTLDFFAQYIACGIDPQKSKLFIQSHVSAHAELCWLLNCFTYFGELKRMTQFKSKSDLHSDNINVGLFDYPVLMVADILLYNTDMVPIGADQKQHLELARNIANRFNQTFGDVFKIPDYSIPKIGARIMSLQEPTKKMSKSDSNMNNKILIIEEDVNIVSKIKKAVTDNVGIIKYDTNRPGITNLVDIMSSCTGETIQNIEDKYINKGYGIFKKDVADAVISTLTPIREEYKKIRQDENYLLTLAETGAQKASILADATLYKVYDAVGFINKRLSI